MVARQIPVPGWDVLKVSRSNRLWVISFLLFCPWGIGVRRQFWAAWMERYGVVGVEDRRLFYIGLLTLHGKTGVLGSS
jgi:hypothetical protein